MSRTIRFILRETTGTPVDELVPTKMSELLDTLVVRLEGVDAGSGDSVNIGPQIPSPDNAGKPWIRTDSEGKPLGLFMPYQGTFYKMDPPIGAQMEFFGNEADVLSPWYKADGNNGTTDRSGSFPSGGIIIEWRGF